MSNSEKSETANKNHKKRQKTDSTQNYGFLPVSIGTQESQISFQVKN